MFYCKSVIAKHFSKNSPTLVPNVVFWCCFNGPQKKLMFLKNLLFEPRFYSARWKGDFALGFVLETVMQSGLKTEGINLEYYWFNIDPRLCFCTWSNTCIHVSNSCNSLYDQSSHLSSFFPLSGIAQNNDWCATLTASSHKFDFQWLQCLFRLS